MLIFDHAHPKIIEITLNFPEFALACKNPVQSIDLFWDTVSFRVLRTEWPQPFLTMPTQIFFDQLLIHVNLYEQEKNQAISLTCSGDMVD